MKIKKPVFYEVMFSVLALVVIALGYNALQKNENHTTLSTNSPVQKTDGPSEFARYHQLIRTRWGDSAPTYTTSNKQKELKKAQQKKLMLKSASTKLNWKERGPGNLSGRVRALIVDPDDPSCNTWFIGSASGGIWKTTNAGESWQNLSSEFQNLGTSTLAMAASNTNVIYAGTGEVFEGAFGVIGDGILKSNDKGETWEVLKSTTINDDFKFINRIVVDPMNENILLAATKTSIQKSIDGGETWSNVYPSLTALHQIIADPTNFNVLYATCDGIYDNDRLAHVYFSDNSGNTWSICKTTSLNSYFNEQNNYNNAVAVSPENTNRAFIGCVDLYQLDIVGVKDDSLSIISTYSQNVASFMDFNNYGQKYLYGSMQINTEKTNYKTIEIQFGPGKAQKAHRFLVPEGRTSGVEDSLHFFTDYVEVPFEVWDIENNRQLMVSFRDQDRNGAFNLYYTQDYSAICREYIWIQDVDYAENPSSEIAQNGGKDFEVIGEIWPILPETGHWDASALPESKIVIARNTFKLLDFNFSPLASGYTHEFPDQNIPYIHADIHNIQVVKKQDQTNRIVVANDGGVCYSDDEGKTWKNPLNGLNTTQFYGVDKHPRQDRYIGGMQDNGSSFSLENPDNLSKWKMISSGDGFDAVWNAQYPEKMISSVYYNWLILSSNGGKTVREITTEIEDHGAGNAPFITRIGYTPNDPDKLYLSGPSGITISEDFGLNWKKTEIPNETWRWVYSSIVVPSPADPNVVWAASSMTNQAKIHVSIDGGLSFQPTQNYSYPMGLLSGLAVHPLDRNTAYALFSFDGHPKIIRTNDFGQTWGDITGFENGESNNGFPNVAVYSLLVMPHNPNEIWVGTEIGLFISHNNGESWEFAGNGLPSISIWDIKLRGNQVVLATYGRGIWTADLPGLPSTDEYPTIINAGTSPSNKTNIEYCLNAAYDSVKIKVDDDRYVAIENIKTIDVVETKPFDLGLDEGKHTIKIEAYKDGSILSSLNKTFFTVHYNESQYKYSNDFDTYTNDFINDGDQFSIISYPFLGEGMDIVSEHPYPENYEFNYYLKTPIINGPNQNNLSLSYKDIPIIELGEEDSIFGSEYFYDYVAVEASADGFNWKTLCDGYDFSAIDKSTLAFINKDFDSNPSSSMFIHHNLSVSDRFNEGDTLMFRFRLFSDEYSTGWGWVIDNIDIQSQKTSTSNVALLINSIYPVPCSNYLNIEMNAGIDEKVQLSIYDLKGRKVLTQSVVEQSKIVINTSDLIPSVYVLEMKRGEYVDRKKFQVSR
jgi:photosystem II stability/assembly factor-like uncharacterized protein